MWPSFKFQSNFFQWTSEVAACCRSNIEGGGLDLCLGHWHNWPAGTDTYGQMDPSARDFNHGPFYTTPSWEDGYEAAGTEGNALCGTKSSAFCFLLAFCASEDRIGTSLTAPPPHVSCHYDIWLSHFYTFTISLTSSCTEILFSMSSLLSRLEQADGEVLNYLLEFVNWSTLSPPLKLILDQRQAEKTWEPCAHFGTLSEDAHLVCA